MNLQKCVVLAGVREHLTIDGIETLCGYKVFKVCADNALHNLCGRCRGAEQVGFLAQIRHPLPNTIEQIRT